MEGTIVLYPSPAIGHLISMVELGKLILKHQPSLSINILITNLPYQQAGSTTPYINHVSTTTPSITFHHLPTVSLPPNSTSPHHETLTLELLHHNRPNLRQALLSIFKSSTIHALIIDFFCTSALPVAADLNLPCYYFFTSGASASAQFLHFPTTHHRTGKSFTNLNCNLDIPGLPPIPAKDLPKPMLERTDKVYEYFLQFTMQMPKSAGIIVNTFDMLEPRALKALSDGLCVPTSPTPPIFCVGPLIAAGDRRDGGGSGGGELECLTWLDSQPTQSVVFLCFGSLGLFSSQQLREIAIGLERSGQRFLWVVRNPPPDDQNNSVAVQESEPDLDSLLPVGFLERTKERGLVVKQWAPQVAVLNHDSVGGFVTHCGWNSVLEAICGGVPMVAWPLYAEQRLNRVILVEELKIALPMKESEDKFVSAAEVEKRVKELMNSEGNSLRNQTIAMKEAAKEALSQEGSSWFALTKLVESWKQV